MSVAAAGTDRKRTDGEIAGTVRLTLEWDPFLPERRIRIRRSAGAAGARQRVRSGIRNPRGRAKLLPPDERCAAIIFLAATGCPQQCRFRRRDGIYCSLHRRERTSSS